MAVVVDPHLFLCGSRSRSMGQTNAEPYLDPDLCVTLKSQKIKKHTYEGTKSFRKAGNKVLMLLDSGRDLHSQYGSGSRTTKSVRILVDPDPQHWLENS
jgi:hypothetical protein